MHKLASKSAKKKKIVTLITYKNDISVSSKLVVVDDLVESFGIE
jgi:hypothetical protein